MNGKVVAIVFAVVLIALTFGVSFYIIKINTNPIPNTAFWHTIVPANLTTTENLKTP